VTESTARYDVEHIVFVRLDVAVVAVRQRPVTSTAHRCGIAARADPRTSWPRTPPATGGSTPARTPSSSTTEQPANRADRTGARRGRSQNRTCRVSRSSLEADGFG
jgi:hypothetical protein